MNHEVLIDHGATSYGGDGQRLQPGSVSAVSSRLPSYHTLAYLEKAGTVTLIALAFVYLLVRSLKAGPMTAIAEVGAKRI